MPASVEVTFRIPGNWSHPRELLTRLPEGHRLTADELILPDGARIEFNPLPPDDQFPGIFRSTCRREPTREEMRIVRRYTVNVGLTGPGGSLDAAKTMLQAGAAIVRAGGAGVFIDNSGLAHGGGQWLELADDAGPEAVSFAYVTLVRGDGDVYTLGMHVMGLPDVIVKEEDLDPEDDELIETLCYLCRGEKPIAAGHFLGDERGPRFQAVAAKGDDHPKDTPMHNPFGRLRLVHVRDVAEGN
jgi:hypothetical protein